MLKTDFKEILNSQLFKSPKEYNEIDQLILDGVDYIVALRTNEIRTNPSTLISIEANGALKTLRA